MPIDQHDEELRARRAVKYFRDVVIPHLGDALALARWLTGSRHDAEDVVQDACIRALAGMATYDGRGDKAWLLSIVRNTCFTWLAKNRPKDLVMVGSMADLDALQGLDCEAVPSAETVLIVAADATAIHAALMALPAIFREVVVLRDINGLSYKEIAAMLAVPIGTVMSRLARGRAALAARLGREAA